MKKNKKEKLSIEDTISLLVNNQKSKMIFLRDYKEDFNEIDLELFNDLNFIKKLKNKGFVFNLSKNNVPNIINNSYVIDFLIKEDYKNITYMNPYLIFVIVVFNEVFSKKIKTNFSEVEVESILKLKYIVDLEFNSNKARKIIKLFNYLNNIDLFEINIEEFKIKDKNQFSVFIGFEDYFKSFFSVEDFVIMFQEYFKYLKNKDIEQNIILNKKFKIKTLFKS